MGTTIEALSAYLPYGVELRRVDGREPDRWPFLLMLNAETNELKRGSHLVWQPVSEWLPVLRPFSALTKRLPNGEIPAVEVAKTMVTGWGKEHIDWANTTAELQDDVVCVDFQDGGQVFIFSDMRGIEVAGIDYLRRNLFAVTLTADQFIEKQD